MKRCAAVHVELFGTRDGARVDEAIALRIEVFVEEQRVPLDEEVDEHDAAADTRAVHALARDARGAPIGTGRYYAQDAKTARVGRMAVRATARAQGVGRALLDALLADARAHGFTRAVLNAQDHAVAFYTAAGFLPYDPPNVECGIPHQRMERALGA